MQVRYQAALRPDPEGTMLPAPVFIVTTKSKISERSGTTEIVLEALDVVFAEVCPLLDLDDDHVLPPDVFDSVDGSLRYVEGVSPPHSNFLPVERDESLSPNDMPVLGTVPVPLQTQSLPREDEELFDLAPFLLVKDEVMTPGALFPFSERCMILTGGIQSLTDARFTSLASPGASPDLSLL
jgi:hypothetical protein